MKKRLSKKPIRKILILSSIFLVLPIIAETGSSNCLEITNIRKTVEGNQLEIQVFVENQCGEPQNFKIEAGSEETGYKTQEVSIEGDETKKYIFNFRITQKEEFEVSIVSEILGNIETRKIEAEPDPAFEESDRTTLINFILDNLVVIISIVIITIIGIILITPFINHPKGTKPFEEEITLEDLK